MANNAKTGSTNCRPSEKENAVNISPSNDQSTTTAAVKTPPLYKVLVDGTSAHGGSLSWSLPTKAEDGAWQAGAWTEVTGALELCSNGLHLTSQPIVWYLDGATLYLAEYDGEIVGGGPSDKVCVRRARLVAEADWAEHQVYLHGEHSVSAGKARAYDSATVRASDSATVRAYDSATVRAYGSAEAQEKPA